MLRLHLVNRLFLEQPKVDLRLLHQLDGQHQHVHQRGLGREKEVFARASSAFRRFQPHFAWGQLVN